MAVKSAVRALQTELKELSKQPVEGFIVKLANEDNLFKWEVGIFGPPKTLYQGGYFKAILTFPEDYPYSPPTMKFLSKMFHPNIYENGEVCISILHSPGDDPASGELPSERWNPTQSVRTILLSVISMLNEPNIHSAAHVDASVAYRKWRDSNGREGDYANIVKKLVKQSQIEASRASIKVPLTLEEYCNTGRTQTVGTLGDKSGPSGGAGASATGYGNDVMMDEDCFMEPYDEDDYFIEDDDDDDVEEDDAGGNERAESTSARHQHLPPARNVDRDNDSGTA